MQYAREDSTSLSGHVLEGERSRLSPNPSHSDTKERSDSEELLERLTETCSEGEGGDEQEVENERPLSTVGVAGESKDDGTLDKRLVRGMIRRTRDLRRVGREE